MRKAYNKRFKAPYPIITSLLEHITKIRNQRGKVKYFAIYFRRKAKFFLTG